MHFDIPKGASHKVDLIAAQIIEKYNISKLDSISKNILKIVIKHGHWLIKVSIKNILECYKIALRRCLNSSNSVSRIVSTLLFTYRDTSFVGTSAEVSIDKVS